MSKRVIGNIDALIFEDEFPIYVNRVTESFTQLEHTHDFYEMTYVAEGKGTHYINGQAVPVSRGDLFWIPLGVSHVFRPAGAGLREALIVYNCIFQEEAMIKAEQAHTSSLFAFYRQLSGWRGIRAVDNAFASLFESLHREYTGSLDFSRLTVQCNWLMLLVQFKRVLEQPSASDASGVATIFDNMLHDIRNHPEREHTAEKVARSLQLSVRQLQRLFRERMDMGFKAYLQEVRIQQCCELLRTTELTVTEIHQAVGYQDAKHFHALFKRKTGKTPGEYRRSVRI
ncbi:AraC family transcriptional regulator [Paenibacillus sp. J5C_2022]|uniref:AraC family transcriptional regulator n=1 Tax=Paenibacillus sp. J5C2022 TaxID=2977129 RepID=UPI0021D2B249|nr:AraC family transcriptional regulator [Paenibacillus sp. J5C2022]MCU6709163.1 AraC family transcriptional regulator [Paenibacillus sp. J5C2022]